jgi:hypothetical protein
LADDSEVSSERSGGETGRFLCEFLKEHRKVEKQAELNLRQEATIARLQAALNA